MPNYQETDERFDEQFGKPKKECVLANYINGDICTMCGHPFNPNTVIDEIKAFIHQEKQLSEQQVIRDILEIFKSKALDYVGADNTFLGAEVYDIIINYASERGIKLKEVFAPYQIKNIGTIQETTKKELQ